MKSVKMTMPTKKTNTPIFSGMEYRCAISQQPIEWVETHDYFENDWETSTQEHYVIPMIFVSLKNKPYGIYPLSTLYRDNALHINLIQNTILTNQKLNKNDVLPLGFFVEYDENTGVFKHHLPDDALKENPVLANCDINYFMQNGLYIQDVNGVEHHVFPQFVSSHFLSYYWHKYQAQCHHSGKKYFSLNDEATDIEYFDVVATLTDFILKEDCPISHLMWHNEVIPNDNVVGKHYPFALFHQYLSHQPIIDEENDLKLLPYKCDISHRTLLVGQPDKLWLVNNSGHIIEVIPQRSLFKQYRENHWLVNPNVVIDYIQHNALDVLKTILWWYCFKGEYHFQHADITWIQFYDEQSRTSSTVEYISDEQHVLIAPHNIERLKNWFDTLTINSTFDEVFGTREWLKIHDFLVNKNEAHQHHQNENNSNVATPTMFKVASMWLNTLLNHADGSSICRERLTNTQVSDYHQALNNMLKEGSTYYHYP